jgi:hypothetical protein
MAKCKRGSRDPWEHDHTMSLLGRTQFFRGYDEASQPWLVEPSPNSFPSDTQSTAFQGLQFSRMGVLSGV